MKFLHFSIIIAIIIGNIGLQAKPIPSGVSATTESNHEYENKASGYAITYPVEWSMNELKEMGLDVLVLLPPNALNGPMQQRITVVYSKVDDGLDLDKFYNMSLDNLKETIPQFKIEEFSPVKLGNIEAKKVVYYDKEQRHNSKIIQYFVVSNNRVFIITCSADPQEFSQYQGVFDTVAKSFRLLD